MWNRLKAMFRHKKQLRVHTIGGLFAISPEDWGVWGRFWGIKRELAGMHQVTFEVWANEIKIYIDGQIEVIRSFLPQPSPGGRAVIQDIFAVYGVPVENLPPTFFARYGIPKP